MIDALYDLVMFIILFFVNLADSLLSYFEFEISLSLVPQSLFYVALANKFLPVAEVLYVVTGWGMYVASRWVIRQAIRVWELIPFN